MFYSHTFLARKGPLGTVWCAAHVQHRLKKSHYTSTDIPKTVERIMCPEVPIALRMSGHLLLGVVRIYSKKIDYLYQDWNALLLGINKAFDASVDVNLPKDASHAKSDDVTLPSPSKFALDELDLEEYSPERFHDNHCKSLEDITLADQISDGRDLYIAVNISEDGLRDSTHLEDAPGSGPVPMEEDSPPSNPMDTSAGVHDPGPSNRLGVNEMLHEDINPLEFEQMRDAVPSQFMVGPPILHDRENDVLEPDTVLVELMGGKNKDAAPVEEMIVSGGKSNPQQENQEPQSTPSEQAPDNDGSPISFALASSDLAIRPSPPVEQRRPTKDTAVVEEMLVSGGKFNAQQENQEPQSATSEQAPNTNGLPSSLVHRSPNIVIQPSPPVRQPRPRKRKRLFDKETVLNNKFMKNAIEDSNDLMRRKNDWCSSLGLWRLKNKQKQERVFLEPLITGLSDDLCSIFNKDCISAKCHLVLEEEAYPDPNVAQPPPVNDLDMEIERPRNVEGLAEHNNIMSELMNSSSSPRNDDFTHATSKGPGLHSNQVDETLGTGVQPTSDFAASTGSPAEHNNNMSELMNSSPHRRDDFTPATSHGLGSHSIQVDVTFGTGVQPTSDFAASTGSRMSEMETPLPSSVERSGFNNSGLYDIPELENSGELTFLDEEDHTPSAMRGTPESDYSSGKQRGTPEVDSLSVRARAVAQYLKMKSLGTPISGEDHEKLSLNTILEGKRRKICARMFFETLVLKNCGLIDVKQDEPYGDILLRVTHKLSKEMFSS